MHNSAHKTNLNCWDDSNVEDDEIKFNKHGASGIMMQFNLNNIIACFCECQ